jgi:hypothetical protein
VGAVSPPARGWSGIEAAGHGAEAPPAGSGKGEVIGRVEAVLGPRRTLRSGGSGSADYGEIHVTGAVIRSFGLGAFRHPRDR